MLKYANDRLNLRLWMNNGMILLQYHSQQVLTELKSMMTEKEMRKEVRKEKQFAKTMATITCLFFLTYFPIFLLKSVIPTDYCYASFDLFTFSSGGLSRLIPSIFPNFRNTLTLQ